MTALPLESMRHSPWIYFPKPNPSAALRLFCFPYAGGSALLFRPWPNHILPKVEICAIQLPGRAERLSEPYFTHINELVPPLTEALSPLMNKPFAIFGYSLGAVIGFEFTRRLRRQSAQQPLHLFVAGRRAPQIPATRAPRYELPEDEFISELKRLKGTPDEVLEHTELRELILPMIRADFALDETYDYRDEPPLDVPLSAYGGLEDPDVSQKEIAAWRLQTTAAFELSMVPGGHFFLHTSPTGLFESINRRLMLLSS